MLSPRAAQHGNEPDDRLRRSQAIAPPLEAVGKTDRLITFQIKTLPDRRNRFRYRKPIFAFLFDRPHTAVARGLQIQVSTCHILSHSARLSIGKC